MSECKRKTSIGGQALIEGIMMRGPKDTSMAIRKPDGTIHLETWPTQKKAGGKPWCKKAPFIRGIFNMIDSLMIGYSCLMKSADISGNDTEEPTKFEKWLSEKTNIKLDSIIGGIAIILGVGLAAVLFVLIPTTIASLFKKLIANTIVLSLIEGLIKVIVLVLYMYLCSKLKEMHRVFEYHGAEHKTIACYEALEDLTVENVRPQLRFHPRCGTSFVILVVLISVIISSFISWENAFIRMGIKIVLIPVVIGVAYELIKLAGKYDNIITRIISAPGLWLQRITTCEPDDSMIEIAIEALKAVIPEDKNADLW